MIKYSVITCLIVSAIGLWSLFSSPYIPLFHDQYQAERVHAMTKAIAFGQLPPRYVSDLGFGLGYALFNFYAPLPYYLASKLVLLGIDLVFSTKLTIAVGFISAFASMYYLVKRYANAQAAILAATLYTLAPYHAVQLYVRGSVGELFAYGLLPFFIAGLVETYQAGKAKSKLILTGITLLFLSHTVTLYMLALAGVITLTAIISYRLIIQKQSIIPTLKALVWYFIVPALLTAYFWIPAFLEISNTQLSLSDGNQVDYTRHFISTAQLWDSAWGYGGSEKQADGMTFMIGKTALLLFAISTVAIIYKKHRHSRVIYLCLLAFALTVFLMTEYSAIVWQQVPYINLIQFPWRWLIFACCIVSIAAALFLDAYKFKPYQFSVILILSTYTLVFPLSIQVVPQNKFFRANTFYQKSSQEITDSNHLTGEVSQVSYEFLYKQIPVLNASADNSIFCSSYCQLSNEIRTPDRYSVNVFILQPGYFTPDLGYFPGYKAFINGRETEIVPGSGRINIFLPSQGQHSLKVQLFDTPVRAISNLISYSALMLLIIGISIQSLMQRRAIKE